MSSLDRELTREEMRHVVRRWVAEYFEIPLDDVGDIPQLVYQDLVAAVLEDMEERVGAR